MEIAKKIIRKINSDTVLKTAYDSISPILFDVTLRDGIQKMDNMTTYDKSVKFNTIVRQMEPQNIEIGSLVSPKILPIMKDTPQLFQDCKQYVENMNPVQELRISGNYHETPIPQLYVLIPSIKRKYDEAVKMGLQNVSIMSSISDNFLLANTKKNMIDTKKDINTILQDNNLNIKIYLSCINECPISGKISNNKVINEIKYYNDYCNVNEICLSDTCGTLKFYDFKEILDNCLEKIPSHKLSLHLHTNDKVEVEKIVRYCLEQNINKFDVSAFDNQGGCSVTIDKNLLQPNLTYDLFYEILFKYLKDNNDGPTISPDSSPTTFILPIHYTNVPEFYESYEEELIFNA